MWIKIFQIYFDWVKQYIDSINPEVSTELFNNVVTFLNYLVQANIENTYSDLEINQSILPEEIHLRGMTIFSKFKKFYGDYDINACTKHEVNCNLYLNVFKLNLFRIIITKANTL